MLRHRLSIAVLLVWSILALSCAADPTEVTADDLGSELDGELSQLTVTLQPRLLPTPGVAVIYELSGRDVKSVRELAMAPPWTGTKGTEVIRYLLVRDERGVIDTAQDQRGGRFVLQRRVAGDRLRVSYLAERAEQPGRMDLDVRPGRVTGVGYSFLALPLLDRRLKIDMRWKLDAVDAPMAASSLGVGSRVAAVARPIDMAHSVYLAGELRVLGGDSRHRLITMGEPTFDAYAVLHFCESALGSFREVFEPGDARPFSFIFIGEPDLDTHHDGASLFQSFAVWFDRERQLDDRLKILLAHEMIHQWLGWKLRLTRPDGSDAKWFSEGLTVHFARTLLLRAGLIQPEEFFIDMQRDLESQKRAFEAPRRPRDQPTSRHHRSPEYHRGALYGARLASQLQSAEARSLESLILQLIDQSRSNHHTLPESRWREAVEELLGPAAGEEFSELVQQGSSPVDVPPTAFGPCFRRSAVRRAVFQLGFDETSLHSDPAVVTGVVAGSEAERAGLRDGMVIERGPSVGDDTDPNRSIDLVVSDASGASKQVSYLPRRWSQSGWTWSVTPTCQRRAEERQLKP